VETRKLQKIALHSDLSCCLHHHKNAEQSLGALVSDLSYEVCRRIAVLFALTNVSQAVTKTKEAVLGVQTRNIARTHPILAVDLSRAQ
jgi:hypothetical protein